MLTPRGDGLRTRLTNEGGGAAHGSGLRPGDGPGGLERSVGNGLRKARAISVNVEAVSPERDGDDIAPLVAREGDALRGSSGRTMEAWSRDGFAGRR